MDEPRSHTDMLLKLIQSLSRSTDLDKGLQDITAQCTETFHTPCCFYLLDESRNWFIPHTSAPREWDEPPAFPVSSDLLKILPHAPAVISCNTQTPLAKNLRRLFKVLRLCPAAAMPVVQQGQVLGLLLLGENNDLLFTPDETDTLQAIVNLAGLWIENVRLNEKARRRLAESESLQRTMTTLLQKLPLDDILKTVCSEAANLTGATGSAVLLLEDDQAWLRVRSSSGYPPPDFDLGRLPVADPLMMAVIQHGKPWISNQPANNDSSSMHRRNSPPDTLLIMPLRVRDVPIGALDVVGKPGGFTQDDLWIMSLFADQAAIAIEIAKLYEQAEQLAVMEERQRLAREMHDSLTQALYSLALYVDAARMALNAQKLDAVASHLDALRNMARETMLDMRLLIFELHPPILEEEGLTAALQARLDAVEARAGVQTHLNVEGERRLPPAVEMEIYRIVQEALNNVVKHAHAQAVNINLDFGEERFEMRIWDDGVGFDPDTAGQLGGMGLQNMLERMHQIGGTLRIKSAPNRGTLITAEVIL
jgi:signal transduction histidine kinase